MSSAGMRVDDLLPFSFLKKSQKQRLRRQGMWKYFMRCSAGDAADGFIYAGGVIAGKRIAVIVVALRLVVNSVVEPRKNICKN